MKGRAIYSIFCILWVCSISQTGQACTTFCLDRDGNLLYGKNYDWNVDDGLVILNKSRVSKTALPDSSSQPGQWTSKYGSVSFNQYGRELPSGGMNEAGLVIEVMWLNQTEYPTADSRPVIGTLQWIQYQLDNFSTVKEVIDSDSRIRVRGTAKVHYLVCDKRGNCVTIEFIDGKLVYHIKETLPLKTLANSPYAKSIGFFHEQEESAMPGGNGSLQRFVRASNLVKSYNPETSKPAVDYAFDILENVAQGDHTKWSIVYDIPNRRIYFGTFANPKTRYVDLQSLDFSCDTAVKVLDINADLSGNISEHFIDYTTRINRDLIGNAYGKTTFLQGIPAEILDRLSRYPESTTCLP